MRSRVKLPRLGDMQGDVVVLEWCVGVGTRVTEGAPLLIVETDKVDTEVPTPIAGILVEQLVAPHDVVQIGAPVAVIDT